MLLAHHRTNASSIRAASVLALLVVASPSSSRGQGYEVWHVDGSDSSYLIAGGALDRFDDVDGDGIADLLVGAPQNQNYGTITLRSGANGATLWTIAGASSHVGLGLNVATLGDVDGDGASDLASITMDSSGFVYSGATQQFLYSFSVYYNQSSLAAIADADADGVRDFAVGNPQGNAQVGTVSVFSGATGALITTLDGEAYPQNFGRTVRGVGDLDADGVDDFMVGAQHALTGSANGKIWAYSGATLARIWRRTGDKDDMLGWDFAPVGDLDQDGHADVAVAALGANHSDGKLVIYSGFQATVLREIEGDDDGIFFGWSLHPAGDLLGDGAPDSKLLVTSSPYASTGRIDAVDAATGAFLGGIDGVPGEYFANSSVGLGDVDGDGFADVAVTSPLFHPSSFYYWGRITTFGWRFAPCVESVAPARGRYDGTTPITVNGAWFDHASSLAVTIGGAPATNVQVVDNRTLTCTAPTGAPGPADLAVTTDLGTGTLAGSFTFTPAVLVDASLPPGGSGVIRYLIDPNDTLLAIAGVPPQVALPIPPFDGTLAILPFVTLFVVVNPLTDEFQLPILLPNDPALSGLDFLLQALAGPQLGGKGKSGSWTNCATLHVE